MKRVILSIFCLMAVICLSSKEQISETATRAQSHMVNEDSLYVHMYDAKGSGIRRLLRGDLAGNYYVDYETFFQEDNVGAPLSLFEKCESDGDSFFYSAAFLPGEFTFTSDLESMVLVLNKERDSTNVYRAKYRKDTIAVLHEKRIAYILDVAHYYEEEWAQVKVKDDAGKEIIGWINCKILGSRHGFDANGFILNKPGEAVSLYLDKELTKKRITCYPPKTKDSYGKRVWVNGKVNDEILELEYSGEKTYCRVGDICVMTDKGKNASLILRAEPDNDSQVVGETRVNQCAIVLDATDDWLKVRLLTKDARFADGWIPNEMTSLPRY